MIRSQDLMQRDVICVSPEMDVRDLARLFQEKAISGAPVVDHEGHLVGIVSTTDLAHLVAEQGTRTSKSRRATVREIMTSPVLCIDENCPLAEMMDIMTRARIHRLVVTRNDVVVGMVTASDIIRFLSAWPV